MPRGIALLLFGIAAVALALVAAPAAATPAAADAGTAAQDAPRNGTTLWANGTVVAEDLDGAPLDISDAGPNGSMHVVYANDSGVQYVRLTTRGTVEQRATLSDVDEIRRVAVAADNDGRAHVLYAGTRNIDEQFVARTVVGPDGGVAFEHDIDTGTRALRETTAVGPFGRVFGAVGSELVVFDDDTSAQSSRSVAGSLDPRVAVRGEQLYVVAGQGYSSTPGPDRHYIHLTRYRLTSSAVEQVESGNLAPTQEDTTGVAPRALAVHPGGYIVVPVDRIDANGRRSPRWRYFINIETDEQVGKRFGVVGHTVLYDRNTRLFLFAGDRYRRYSPEFDRQLQSSRATVDAGLNRDGYPSVLQIDEHGTLTYVPMVVAGTERYEDPYDRFESLNATLIAENQRLRERVADLRNRSRSITINVTVLPGGDESAFVAGGEARVLVESGSLPASEATVRADGETYAVGENGTATVPLPEAGTQEITVEYRNATATATVEVEGGGGTPTDDDTPTDDGDGSDGDDGDGDGGDSDAATETTSGSGPGLGVGAALVALALVVGALRRRD